MLCPEISTSVMIRVYLLWSVHSEIWDLGALEIYIYKVASTGIEPVFKV